MTTDPAKVDGSPQAPVVLELDSITAGYGGAPVISEVSVSARAGRCSRLCSGSFG